MLIQWRFINVGPLGYSLRLSGGLICIYSFFQGCVHNKIFPVPDSIFKRKDSYLLHWPVGYRPFVGFTKLARLGRTHIRSQGNGVYIRQSEKSFIYHIPSYILNFHSNSDCSDVILCRFSLCTSLTCNSRKSPWT